MQKISRLLLLLVLVPFCGSALPADVSVPVVAGYVFPQNGALQPGQIDPHALTRVNYAFATIRNGRMVLSEAGDAADLAQLTALRKQNPALEILISVGGWLGSGGFSDMALTVQRRHMFIESAMDFLARYDLDGLDVDWEYPGVAGASSHFRSADKHNFTLLIEELRERFNEASKKTHRRFYLTIAAGAFDDYLAHTEMAEVARQLDAVNLMSYDYYEPGSDALTGNHAPLFTDPNDPKKDSADASVQAFERAGVPAEKIVLGVPFYGQVWGQVAGANHGLFQPGKPVPNSYVSYDAIAGTMLGHGFTRFWDAASEVPYLYSEDKRIFVSYEDAQSLALKCNYIRSHRLGGVMFWNYFNDSKGALLRAIDQAFHVNDAAPRPAN